MNEEILQKDIHDFLSALIEKGVSLNASDIHIDPGNTEVDIRMRVAGNIHSTGSFKKDLLDVFIGKVKVLASLRSDVHDRAQDGRFYHITATNAERIDIRVSIAPTFFGENCVMRI